MNTVRKTISMPEKVHEAAKRQMQEYGYGEFSDYIQALIRADTGVQPASQMVLRDLPAKHPQPEPTSTSYKKLRKKKTSSKALSEAEQKIVDIIQEEADRLSGKTQPKPEK